MGLALSRVDCQPTTPPIPEGTGTCLPTNTAATAAPRTSTSSRAFTTNPSPRVPPAVHRSARCSAMWASCSRGAASTRPTAAMAPGPRPETATRGKPRPIRLTPHPPMPRHRTRRPALPARNRRRREPTLPDQENPRPSPARPLPRHRQARRAPRRRRRLRRLDPSGSDVNPRAPSTALSGQGTRLRGIVPVVWVCGHTRSGPPSRPTGRPRRLGSSHQSRCSAANATRRVTSDAGRRAGIHG